MKISGIIEKLDHFTKTGISGVWLSPIYKSPQVDNGYDISDYRDIGTFFHSQQNCLKISNNYRKYVRNFVRS